MSRDPADRPRSTAVEQLEALGLSTYAARTFVALVGLGDGTAQDVSEVADVPRTRVYDAADELREHGLVDVRQSNPKRFWAVSAETAGRHFEAEYAHRVSTLTAALDALEPTNRTSEQRGVWTVTGRDAVTERVAEFVSTAGDEVVFTTVDSLLTDGVVESLRRASDRGATIRFAEMSPSAGARLQREVPDARLFESLWDWSETPAGRLLMVDREKTLVSVRVDADGDRPPEPRDETAIWGSGPENGLVVVLNALFAWQLDGSRG
ncbi:TrmB family transcriptional regulator [Halobacterium yunchengense]|uniref:TrmB family transcriptional regulator n=1 Tax=Halobacterium yunchengense TaxID=3108497 RepID=UPI0030083C80